MQREIGSNFWINPHESLSDKTLSSPTAFGCDGSDYAWLSTGRSAIRFVIKAIEERHPGWHRSVVLPPFTCHTVIEPFVEAGYEIHYYSVDELLNAQSAELQACVRLHDASVLLFHRYYGFDTLHEADELCNSLRDIGIVTIEDCTQCLYSSFKKSQADYFVGSIRKWTGTPDGGFAVCREGFFHNKPCDTDRQLESAKVKASYAKYKYLFENIGSKDAFLAQYREAEDILSEQEGFYTLSETSRRLQADLDKEWLKETRRVNYQILLDELKPSKARLPLFNSMEVDEVPLYFPLWVDDRRRLQTHLAQHAIFAPVVWPKTEGMGGVCPAAERAYEHLLCIPIDQRYDWDDMDRIAETINNYR